jgi:hypothetical protein
MYQSSVSLAGRIAKCAYFSGCGHSLPSSTDLPFFEYRGEGSQYAKEHCKNCPYTWIAHQYGGYYYPGLCKNSDQGQLFYDKEIEAFRCQTCGSTYSPESLRASKGGKVCENFEPLGDSPDQYYCGCHGWD